MNKRTILSAILLAGFLAGLMGGVASAISPDYLPDGRTYDQARNYFQWNGAVGLVTIYHRDQTTIPPEEGGDSCSDGCIEQITRIYSGSSISGNFTNLQGFNVQVASTGNNGTGTAIIRACGQVIATEHLYKAGARNPGFYNAPSPMWSVPTAGDCTWSITASGGYVDFRAVTTDVRQNTLPTVDLRIDDQDGPLSLTDPAGFHITWTAGNADSCTASGDWNGVGSLFGDRAFANIPTGTYSYTLTCSNLNGASSDSVTARVYARPTVDVQVNSVDGPLTLTRPATYVVSWTSTSAITCRAEGDLVGPISLSGSQILTNVDVGEYEYGVRCTNEAGAEVTDSVSVSVRTPLPDVDLQVNGQNGPLVLISPADLQLTWRSQNADGCALSSIPTGLLMGAVGLNGSQLLAGITTGSYRLTLTCSNAAGVASDTLDVTLVDPLTGELTVYESRLILYPSRLDQPAQTISGEVSGGMAPFISEVTVRSPSGAAQTYRRNGTDWLVDAGTTGNADFGATEQGTWTAWAEVSDGLGQTYRTASVTWEVSWFPVHGLP